MKASHNQTTSHLRLRLMSIQTTQLIRLEFGLATVKIWQKLIRMEMFSRKALAAFALLTGRRTMEEGLQIPV
ncbi:hypothetical protein bas10_0008 [Escherichia phage IsaakIselin]|uniref:Uncharacterized protein n=1 Tax=Escherichia phage IsaakIselin TaxID=2851974 RepID=A0AAE7VTZ3_9CAUD|nr:hypothetical protein bas10_0008 [Escherichia phage IsaakIselin]